MKEIILQKLLELEQSENIRILYTCESGSRAWGFASPKLPLLPSVKKDTLELNAVFRKYLLP